MLLHNFIDLIKLIVKLVCVIFTFGYFFISYHQYVGERNIGDAIFWMVLACFYAILSI
jgi:hypothetical protein